VLPTPNSERPQKLNRQTTEKIDFDAPPCKDLYKDEKAFDLIQGSIPSKLRSEVKIELEWIQKVHRDGRYEKRNGEWVVCRDNTNLGVINHFNNNYRNKLKNGDSMKCTDEDLERIVKELKAVYP
jgi:hypothetical protein